MTGIRSSQITKIRFLLQGGSAPWMCFAGKFGTFEASENEQFAEFSETKPNFRISSIPSVQVL